MRIPNEPADDPSGPLAELLRLQTQFQARLAEETLTYLRRLQGATAPATPGTVLMPDPNTTLEARGRCGQSVELRVELENRQRVHCMVRPLLGELVSASGVAWQPEAEAEPPTRLVAPGEWVEMVITVALPDALPSGTYRGSLVLLGFRKGALPVSISAEAAEHEPAEPTAPARRSEGTRSASTAAAGSARRATRRSPASAKPTAPAKPKAPPRRRKPPDSRPDANSGEAPEGRS
jgi:hypothetical protein